MFDFINFDIFVLIFIKSRWFLLKLEWYGLFCCLSGKYFIKFEICRFEISDSGYSFFVSIVFIYFELCGYSVS